MINRYKENTAAIHWKIQGYLFKEINCIFSTNNFDCRQQFSLAQQFAMQSKLLPLLSRTVTSKQSKAGEG